MLSILFPRRKKKIFENLQVFELPATVQWVEKRGRRSWLGDEAKTEEDLISFWVSQPSQIPGKALLGVLGRWEPGSTRKGWAGEQRWWHQGRGARGQSQQRRSLNCERTSLVVQWLNSELPMQEAQVSSLVRELDPTCHNSRSHVPQLRPSTAK